MSLKVKLISCISLFMLMIGVLIIGVFAATQQTINLKGSVNFDVADKTLYVKDIRLQTESTGQAETIKNFMPGFVNQSFDLDLGTISSSSGSVNVYFDFVNTTSTAYQASATGGSGVTLSTSGQIAGSQTPVENVATAEISGTITLTIGFTGSSSVDLNGITIAFSEYVPADIQVTSVSSSGATIDTYTELAGGVAIDGSVDLSGITFNTGETTLTISMTSLSVNYIKNIVSWYDTPNITISSTSLYLPQNPSEQLTSGTSRDLTITVNNTGSATTISGLEVEFEEKTDLLQVTEEGKPSTYTEEGYWYVEMGTYSTTSDNAEGKRESEYLRWRYFSDTTSHYEFDRNTRPTGEGYFILESYFSSFASINEGGLYCSWNNDYLNASPYKHQLNGWTNIDANDYSTSTIRQYMNSEELVSKSYTSTSTDAGTVYSPSNNASYMSNMFTDLHIDPDNDIVYTQIIGRTLGDLYTDMSSSATNPQDVDFPKGSPDDWTGATITYSREDTDKFWLLSYYEAYTLLSGNATTSSDTDREWGDYYWLRSPSPFISISAYSVSTSGLLSGISVTTGTNAVRAAFKFSI